MSDLNQTSIKHPKGLYWLFFTEMWERFGYYLMLGIFSLYMLDSWDNGGMGFDPLKKSDIYGTYLGLVYLTPFVGGLLADRVLGYRKSIIIGGLLMASGYLLLSIHSNETFYVALLLIILGNGFFKPNISTLLGNLYNKDEYKSSKDAGYNIFYMGINIGAFVCNFVAAFMRNSYGWNWAFIAAGVGMLIGVATFIAGSGSVKEADVKKPLEEGDLSTAKILLFTIVPMFVFGILGYLIPGNILGTDTNDAFIIGCIPVVGFYIYLYVKANATDKRPIGALLAVYACLVIFWAVFHQNGDALTVWAKDVTDREVPTQFETFTGKLRLEQKVEEWYRAPGVDADKQVVLTKLNDSLSKADKKDESQIKKIEKEIEFTKTFASYYKKKSIMDSLKTAKDVFAKEDKSDEVRRVKRRMDVITKSAAYYDNLQEELEPPSGQSLRLISTELYQSINPFWVVLLTPVVVGFWGFLRRRKKEPSTPTKIAIGLVITALSALVMVGAVMASNNLGSKASSWWLIASYAVITLGELCLSPMGLSLVSKLSPPRITALMMGGFFLSTAVGNKLSGMLSGLWEGFDNKANFFYMNFGLAMAAAVMLFLLLKWLNAVMREKNIH